MPKQWPLNTVKREKSVVIDNDLDDLLMKVTGRK